ncbi:MAG: response regulator [Candidatus Odinarchaeota archaeon]
MTDVTDGSLPPLSEETNVTCCSTGSTGGPLKILHVDDEKPFLELVKLYLESHSDSVRVKSAASTSQFFSLLSKCSYDVIISDYRMPEMNGLDLLLETRKRGIESPFILLTGEDAAVITRQALEYHGVNSYGYFLDPFQLHEFLGIGWCYQCYILNFTGVDYYLNKKGNVHDLFNELLYFLSLINEKRSKHLKDLLAID